MVSAGRDGGDADQKSGVCVMQDTGLDYVALGRRYPIFVGPGNLPYIFDPKKQLLTERASARAYLESNRGAGLGQAVDTAVQAVATAANFIPGVGPIISAVLNIGDAIFGGGDPTALSLLISQIVQLREQIAQANIAAGVPDSFVVPAGFNPQDKGQFAGFVDGIVESVLGVTEPQIQKDRRKDYYAAIAKLQSILASATQNAHEMQLVSAIEAQLAPVANPSGTSGAVQMAGAVDGGDTSTGLTGQEWGLLALAAGGAILLSRRL
jgi:hypothetical protein